MCSIFVCVSEEHEDADRGEHGEDAGSQAPSLLSDTLRYINLAEVAKSLCMIGIKRELGGQMSKDVGAVRDKELKLENGEASHTLGGAGEGDT
jgi:hypothetical protein